jgi:signal recognition particle subunit SRP54
MFEALGDKFDAVFKKLRGESHLTEENIAAAMREVRMALLEADVNFKVVKDFTTHVREKALGQEVLTSVRPGQMFVKIVHDELVEMMGGAVAPFELQKGRMNVILLLGLQGSGKTTFAGKLALRCKKEGFSPLLVGCDIYRPAAIQQLHVVGKNIGVPVFDQGTNVPADQVAVAGVEEAKRRNCNLVIIDTAGRLHIDEVKMDELEAIKAKTKPHFAFFVADAMTGQDAVTSATQFNEHIGIDGVCLTKLDGDARGGAALSIRAVTGRPIYFVGVGEKAEDLEPFHPDRLAGRILGMGDIVTLVEKAQEGFDEKNAEEMQKKLRKEEFTLQDFMDQMNKVKKMGPLKGLMGMIPGMKDVMKQVGEIDDDAFKPMEALIQSMTPWERAHPDLIDGARRKRIAKGAGRDAAELNGMLKEFQQTRKMMSEMMKMMGGGGIFGKMKGLANMPKNAEEAAKMMREQQRGAIGQKVGHSADPGSEKLKPKHRRKKKDKKKKH